MTTETRAPTPCHPADVAGHTHSVECSTRFWREFRGCNPFHDATNEGKLLCWDRPHGNHELADIIASPGTDEARLAMRDVTEELNRRGYVVVTASHPGGNLASVMLFDHHASPYPPRDTFLHLAHEDTWSSMEQAAELGVRPAIRMQDKHLDRAVALAAWAASLEEGAE